ncbi:hypothetical protein CPAR01_08981 [Colletotrichum paranaense]|uniref:Secreted protein n=1 Tax=Colletotrichum paranaense TaxID=1914294 RepID=A0ABQ9SGL0_9PEZI|nr:uncharacterized protein CPAR01_08981 [Colletotrichum paranaense]KAK1535439.1 hypothetical protein CPAR01_08981 [Colletotrichum paranaense]
MYPYLFLVLVWVSSYLVVSNPFCIFVSCLGTYLSVFFRIKDRLWLNNSALPLFTAPVTQTEGSGSLRRNGKRIRHILEKKREKKNRNDKPTRHSHFASTLCEWEKFFCHALDITHLIISSPLIHRRLDQIVTATAGWPRCRSEQNWET